MAEWTMFQACFQVDTHFSGQDTGNVLKKFPAFSYAIKPFPEAVGPYKKTLDLFLKSIKPFPKKY